MKGSFLRATGSAGSRETKPFERVGKNTGFKREELGGLTEGKGVQGDRKGDCI